MYVYRYVHDDGEPDENGPAAARRPAAAFCEEAGRMLHNQWLMPGRCAGLIRMLRPSHTNLSSHVVFCFGKSIRIHYYAVLIFGD